MVQDTVVSEYEDMFEKGEQIIQVYEAQRFIRLLKNLPGIIFILGWFYFYFSIFNYKLIAFARLFGGVFSSGARWPLYELYVTIVIVPFVMLLVLYLFRPFYRNYKYIITDKKLIVDFPNFLNSNIIYYDKIQKVELIKKRFERIFNLSTIKIFLKSSKVKNKFVVIPAVKNPNEFIANLEKMINGGHYK